MRSMNLTSTLTCALSPPVYQRCAPRSGPGYVLRSCPPGVAPSSCSLTSPATSSLQSRPCCLSTWPSEGPRRPPYKLGHHGAGRTHLSSLGNLLSCSPRLPEGDARASSTRPHPHSQAGLAPPWPETWSLPQLLFPVTACSVSPMTPLSPHTHQCSRMSGT